MNRSSFLKTLGALCVAPFAAAKVLAHRPVASIHRETAMAAEKACASFEELNEIVAKIQDTTGRGGVVMSRAVGTMMDRLHDPEVVALVKRLGLCFDGPGSTGVVRLDVLGSISRAWPTLSTGDRQLLAERLGGVYQMNIVRAFFTT